GDDRRHGSGRYPRRAFLSAERFLVFFFLFYFRGLFRTKREGIQRIAHFGFPVHVPERFVLRLLARGFEPLAKLRLLRLHARRRRAEFLALAPRLLFFRRASQRNGQGQSRAFFSRLAFLSFGALVFGGDTHAAPGGERERSVFGIARGTLPGELGFEAGRDKIQGNLRNRQIGKVGIGPQRRRQRPADRRAGNDFALHASEKFFTELLCLPFQLFAGPGFAQRLGDLLRRIHILVIIGSRTIPGLLPLQRRRARQGFDGGGAAAHHRVGNAVRFPLRWIAGLADRQTIARAEPGFSLQMIFLALFAFAAHAGRPAAGALALEQAAQRGRYGA